jgi:serine O-acetyltransferase
MNSQNSVTRNREVTTEEVQMKSQTAIYIKSFLKSVLLALRVPLLILFFLSTEKQVILLDVKRWSQINELNHNSKLVILLSLLKLKEFISLYYYRIRQGNFLAAALTYIFKTIYKEEQTLFIQCNSIGSGLFLQHAFSTIIYANSIGENCWINQQVTIGHNGKNNKPTIGKNVRIAAGAKVLGRVNIGDNVTVGANAVVVKDVPENCVVVGVPAYIIKRNGVKVKEQLQ